jgi:hypothetical protein
VSSAHGPRSRSLISRQLTSLEGHDVIPSPDPFDPLVAGAIVRGAMVPEPVRVLTVAPFGASVKLVGLGLESQLVYQPVISAEQAALR